MTLSIKPSLIRVVFFLLVFFFCDGSVEFTQYKEPKQSKNRVGLCVVQRQPYLGIKGQQTCC